MEGLGLGQPKKARARMRAVCDRFANAQSEPAQTSTLQRSMLLSISVATVAATARCSVVECASRQRAVRAPAHAGLRPMQEALPSNAMPRGWGLTSIRLQTRQGMRSLNASPYSCLAIDLPS